jgi:RHS repeat-associated protein
VISYLGNDHLSSAEVALSTAGTVQAATLFAPYGLARYASGTMPGTYGFTGQRADGATGLDYYNARYYDPTAGQFAQADTICVRLNRYSYVDGNPESATDPSGHCMWQAVKDFVRRVTRPRVMADLAALALSALIGAWSPTHHTAQPLPPSEAPAETSQPAPPVRGTPIAGSGGTSGGRDPGYDNDPDTGANAGAQPRQNHDPYYNNVSSILLANS